MAPAIGILGIAALLVMIGIFRWRFDKKRSAALSGVAAKLGFAFSTDGDAGLVAQVEGFSLGGQGSLKTAKNVFSGQVEETEVFVFDYSYVVGAGKHTQTWRQTVILFRWPGESMPAFSLSPESLLHRLGELFGYHDIDFPEHPIFSDGYRLKGPNEAAIREVFTPDVLSFYTSKTGISTEMRDTAMILYRAGTLVKPETLGSFYEEGWSAYALLRKLPPPPAA